MAIPSLPAFFDMYYSQDNGKLSPDGYMYNDQTFQSLNLVVALINLLTTSTMDTNGQIVITGLSPPANTTAEIIALEPGVPDGTIWFNTTLAKLQVKTATGVIETITSV